MIKLNNAKRDISISLNSVKTKIANIFRTHNTTFLLLGCFSLFLLYSLYSIMKAVELVPKELLVRKDAFIYYTVAESWLNGNLSLDINFDYGLSLLEAISILLGSLLSLNAENSLIILFSVLGFINMCLIVILSQFLTKSRWSIPLAMFILIIRDSLIVLSVRPLTDTLHSIMILLIILIQLILLEKIPDNENKEYKISFRTKTWIISLGICLGLTVAIRHVALVFVIFTLILSMIFIFSRNYSLRNKVIQFSLLVIPALSIIAFYLVSRALILGNLNLLWDFGANSNLWVDSYDEFRYYYLNGLPNPNLADYLQTHSVFYIFKRELLGILHIFTRSLFPKYILFFLGLISIKILRKEYKTFIVIYTPVFYITAVYGWFWDYVMSPSRYLMPIDYIFSLLMILAIIYIFTHYKDTNLRLASIFICLFWLYPMIIEFPINFLRIFFSIILNIPLIAVIIAFFLISGVFIVVFHYIRRMIEDFASN